LLCGLALQGGREPHVFITRRRYGVKILLDHLFNPGFAQSKATNRCSLAALRLLDAVTPCATPMDMTDPTSMATDVPARVNPALARRVEDETALYPAEFRLSLKLNFFICGPLLSMRFVWFRD